MQVSGLVGSKHFREFTVNKFILQGSGFIISESFMRSIAHMLSYATYINTLSYHLNLRI